MIRPTLPPCPVCGAHVDELAGFGARVTAQPCGHTVTAIFGAGGVTGAVVLRPPDPTGG